MISILIVDDEEPAIEGIRISVDWRSLGITNVYTAPDAQSARRVISENQVDLVLCDIEMPQETGLDLLRWVNRNDPDIICIFLTCHADFTYAREAVHMGAFDYLLKPALISDIESVLRRAVRKWEEETRQAQDDAKWQKNGLTVMEHFWLDVITGILPADREKIARQAHSHNLSPELDKAYLPILCAVRIWNKPLNQWEKGDLEYAFKNMLTELFTYGDTPPLILSNMPGRQILLIPCEKEEWTNMSMVEQSCEKFFDTMKKYFGGAICFYIGEPGTAERLSAVYSQLTTLEKQNVSYDNQLFYVRKQNGKIQREIRPDIESWRRLFLTGHGEELCSQVEEYLRSAVERREMNISVLTLFYHNFMQMVYAALAEQNILAEQLIRDLHPDTGNALESVEHMMQYLRHIVEASMQYIENASRKNCMVSQVKQYIAEHIGEDLSRDLLAGIVYLNPNYLSRLFRNETGKSLVDYITGEKIAVVRKLLLETNLSVTEIAQRLGYTNMPYFSKVFKKETSLSPVEYRHSLDKPFTRKSGISTKIDR